MIEYKPEKIAYAHHAIRPNADLLLKKHIDQLESWKLCISDCLKKGISEEEAIAKEISGVDLESGRLFSASEDFGGLRKALVGSITGFVHLINQE